MEQQGGQRTYIFDPDSAAEMGRLLLQDRLVNEAMGGYFPEWNDLAWAWNILDIGCGPGGWALGVAKQYPHLKVTGIDVSKRMINFAQVQAQRENVSNAAFAVMNALQHLEFADASFDLVNMRAACAWIPRERWPELLRQCYRVARPGGIIRLTETELSISNKQAGAKIMRLISQLLQKMGYGFSPDGATFGITPMLGKLLMDAGCRNVQYKLHAVDFSYGTQLYSVQLQNADVALNQFQPLIVKMGLATEIELRRLQAASQEETRQPDFRALMYWLTAWAQKPEA